MDRQILKIYSVGLYLQKHYQDLEHTFLWKNMLQNIKTIYLEPQK